MGQLHISLRGSQSDAFEDAAELAEEDMEVESPSRGEIVEHLANAYRGKL